MLDSGSEKSFILAKIRDELKLPILSSEDITIITFDINSSQCQSRRSKSRIRIGITLSNQMLDANSKKKPIEQHKILHEDMQSLNDCIHTSPTILLNFMGTVL